MVQRFLIVSLLAALTTAAAEREHNAKVLQPGVQLTLVGEQPDLATPTGIDVDADGNIWVISCHTHFPPKDYAGPKQDEVLVFSPDGRRRLFAARTEKTMDLELGSDGWVYLAERDRILRLRDTDGDGRADREENIAVLDSAATYPHNGLAGLAWHPNGDLYFTLGENFNQRWTLTGTDGRTAEGTGEGGVFHCRPDGSRLTRIARGFWNPFGFCVREDGEMFAAENDPGERPPCRVLHIVDGGDYGFQRQYGPAAHHSFVSWNGELKGTLPMIHPSGEAPCGILPLGRGLLIPSWGDHSIDYFALQPQGASYAAAKIQLVRGTRYFRPTCIAFAEARSNDRKKTWYLTDWVDGSYNVHGFGRLWKLEIDLKEATWLGPLELPEPTEAAQLARQLRDPKAKFAIAAVLVHARSEDPFIARAALVRLGGMMKRYGPRNVGRWFPVDRASAIRALAIGGADPAPWIKPASGDAYQSVVFETLRWIADGSLLDERFREFRPLVEEVLKRPNLSFELFEAGVAAATALGGQPELGLANTEMLLARVKDETSDPKLRAYALRMLPQTQRRAAANRPFAMLTFPKGLTVEMLAGLLDQGDEGLALEAIRVLAGHPTAGQRVLLRVATDESRSAELRAEATAGLAAVAGEFVGRLVELARSEVPAVSEEALRALRNQPLTDPQRQAVQRAGRKDLVNALLDPASLGRNRPSSNDPAEWADHLADLSSEADVDSGRRIFHHAGVALCSRCHRHGGRGKIVGPDLTYVGRGQNRDWLLKAILQPSADVAPEFQSRELTLTDGSVHTGIRLRSYSREQLRDLNGNTITFHKDQVAGIRDLNTSLMPEGLVFSLTDRELRDLLAFLENSK